MSFEPIRIRKSKGYCPVHVALRKTGKGRHPKVVFSIAPDVMEVFGVSTGNGVKPLLGKGHDRGKVRLIKADLLGPDSLVVSRVAGGCRSMIALHPWMDYRGIRIPATPCLYRVEAHDFLEIELPEELAELPPMVAGAAGD